MISWDQILVNTANWHEPVIFLIRALPETKNVPIDVGKKCFSEQRLCSLGN